MASRPHSSAAAHSGEDRPSGWSKGRMRLLKEKSRLFSAFAVYCSAGVKDFKSQTITEVKKMSVKARTMKSRVLLCMARSAPRSVGKRRGGKSMISGGAFCPGRHNETRSSSIRQLP